MGINQVDVTESSNVDVSTTEFEVFNLVQNLPLVFAAPDDDCCNFINDANSVQPGVSNSVTFNSADIPDTSFNAYASGAQCTSLASSLIESNALTLTRSNNGNGCERKAIFLIGRAGQVEDNISGNGDCSTCTSDRNVIADVRQVGAVSSSSNVQQVEFICRCATATTTTRLSTRASCATPTSLRRSTPRSTPCAPVWLPRRATSSRRSTTSRTTSPRSTRTSTASRRTPRTSRAPSATSRTRSTAPSMTSRVCTRTSRTSVRASKRFVCEPNINGQTQTKTKIKEIFFPKI